MKKLFLVLISVLLLTGVASAVEPGQAIVADLSAQNTARTCDTNDSVVLKVWADAGVLTYPGIGVSSSGVIMLYSNYMTGVAYTINTIATATDTVGEVVDYINTNFESDSSIKLHASVGRDVYRDFPINQLQTSNIAACGVTKATGAEITSNHSTISAAGVEAVDGVTPRIKSLATSIPVKSRGSGSDGITLRIYDGNTLIWRKYIMNGVYNNTTAQDSSGNTVTFPEGKGIAATKGNGISATATADANVDGDTPAASIRGISIVYDSLRN